MSQLFRIIFFIGDLLFLNLSVILSYSILGIELVGEERINIVYLIIFSNLTWFFLIIVSNPYSFVRSWGTIKFLRNQISYVVVHLFVVAFLIFFLKKEYSLLQIGIMYMIFVPMFFGWKLLLTFLVTSLSDEKLKFRNMILIGEGELVREVRRYFLTHQELNYRFVGKFGFTGTLQLEEIENLCAQREVHEIFCCVPHINDAEFRKLIDFGLNQFIQVKLVDSFRAITKNDFSFDADESIAVPRRSVVPLDESRNQIIKRVFDLIFSFLVIVLILSWLIPLLGLLIKLDSKGPVYFSQKRGGLNNRPFKCLKFRTMIVNRDADQKQATQDDPRITGFGKFLRKSSLDEFPQFLNVFVGDMSVIGPRPHPLKLNEEFSKKIEGLMSRHYVKPGITGLAQSMGYRGETRNVIDMKNRIELDRFYIENWSILLDIKIIFRTLISLIRGSEKAY